MNTNTRPQRLAFVLASLCIAVVAQQSFAVTATYTMQTGNFNAQTTQNTGPSGPYAGTYNNGATEVANYANTGSFGNTPGAAIFQTFNTTGNGNTGSARSLQVGDTFTITAFTSANPSAGGYLGISFRDSTSYSSFSSATDAATEARFQLDNTGGWKVYNGGTAVDSGLGANSDRTFTIKITSGDTFNATVGGNNYYDLSMAASGGSIDSFSIYTFGDSNQNSFWKSSSLANTGTVELGYAAGNGVTRSFSQVISDGLAADSTSATSVNAVFVGGDAGSQVNVSGNNTYTGGTTVNANATLEVRHANALGTTAAGTTVSTGAALKLYTATGGLAVAEAITLNGVGVSGAGGALINVGGANELTGALTLASNSRIQSSAGSLTLSGNIGGGNNVLFLGGANSTAISGIISGAGGSQSGTTTSLFKDGAGVLTLSGNNSYSGDTRIVEGTLTVASGGDLGDGTSDVFVSSGATLNINANTTVASLRETGNGNGGVTAIGTGATLTVSGADKGTLYQNSISGDGALTVAASGTTSLSLYGTQSFAGATTVSGGKLSTGVALASSGVTVSGGTFEATAANILGNSAAVTVNSGTYTVGGSDTIGALTGTGGSVNITNGTLTATYASGSSSYAGDVTGSGGFAKAGGGKLTLSGNNTKSGANTVSAGTLEVASAGSLSGATTVQSGATLDVDGTLSGTVSVDNSGTIKGGGSVGTLTINGLLAPGNSAGTLTATNGASWVQGGSYDWEIFDLAGPAGTGWDLLDVTSGTLDLTGITTGGGFTINLITLTTNNSTQGSLDGFLPAATYTNWMIARAQDITGFSATSFSLNTNSFVGSTGTWAIAIGDGGGGFDGLFVTYNGGGGAPVPEPGTWAAAALLAGAAAYVRLRRRKDCNNPDAA